MPPVLPPIYAILDSVQLDGNEVRFAQILLESGIRILQCRNKTSSTRSMWRICWELRDLSRRFGAFFVVNDRLDVALTINADGVHVGQDDMDAASVRRICPTQLLVGVSTHTMQQVEEAAGSSADYISVGPIYDTTTKAGADAPVGVEFIRKARYIANKPLVAIGGITIERLREVFEAGADAVAVAGDLIHARDPGERAKQYLAMAEDFRRGLNARSRSEP